MPEVFTVRSEDYDELASFLSSFPAEPLSAQSWAARLRAWWDENPSFTESIPRGWVLRDEGKIVGFIGSIPLRMMVCGKEATTFASTTWRVLPQYRGTSMALQQRQMSEQKDSLRFSTTPRTEVVKLLKLLRARLIDRGEGTDKHSLVFINCKGVLASRIPNASLRGFLESLISPGFRILQRLRARGVRRSFPGKATHLTRADKTFDDLWERTRSTFETTNIRTARAINWYCFGVKESPKELVAYHEDGVLLGYMVLMPSDVPGMRVLECVDLWIDRSARGETVLGALVEESWKLASRGGFDRIVFPHFDKQTAIWYQNLGLISRPAWARSEFMNGPKELLASITPQNSYLVRAQGDYGL